MVRAWVMNFDATADKRLEHMQNPPEFVAEENIYNLTRAEIFHVNPKSIYDGGKLSEIKRKREYIYEEELVVSEAFLKEEFEDSLNLFFQEHLHTDEEIVLVLEGLAYFDVRDKFDRWVRIEANPGDIILIPYGIYHRFTVNLDNYMKAVRFYAGEEERVAYGRQVRETEEMDCRKKHVEILESLECTKAG